ncbi:DoxX family protein [Candidatus Woesearchaeota archaeon CG10_big_fil_rev_8_21_14_0_10_37_12]|nr:MAG: DoxX family protein [Candidatus Woesearchaeota archaeon CG10_big_fil_rev_8_21_14_0_10_37_12]
MKKFAHKNHEYFHFVFRVLIGLLFAQHGAQKLFGLFGGKAAPLVSLMGLAGIIELVGGLLIAVGLFTRFAALVSAITMLVAYFKVHAFNALMPIANKGELALVYLAAFIAIIGFGHIKWELDGLLTRKPKASQKKTKKRK